jgi:hypothetical protein
MAAVFASDPGKAIMEDAAIEITVNNQFDIGTKETILFERTYPESGYKS